MLSTPLTCCSIGVATDCSMVTASAPVKVVVRFTCGGMICGNCAMGSPSSETAPMSTVKIAITIATMGRRMKNEEIMFSPSARPGARNRRGTGDLDRRGLRHHQGAVADLLEAFDHHPFARGDAVLDDAQRARDRADLDPAHLDL